MRVRLIAVAIALLAIVGVVVPVAAASAATPPARAAVPVEGEPWSSPAMPVECTKTVARVDCAPMDPSQAKESACYAGVLSGVGRMTVCTTYPANEESLKAQGGKKLEVSMGCGFGDLLCAAGESFIRAAAAMIGAGISWALDQASFSTSSTLWDTALAEWSWWQGAVLLIIFLAGIIAITTAAVAGDRADVVSAILRFISAFPLSVASVWLIGTLLDIIDGMVEPMVSEAGGSGGLYRLMENLIFGGGAGNVFLAQIVIGMLALSVIVLVFVFSFRNFALAALIAIGPVAWMLFPTSVGRTWVVRYWSAVFALLLTTPLTLGLLSLVVRGLGEIDSLWSIQALPFSIGVCLLVFAPFAAFSLFSFLGGAAAETIGSRAGSGAARAASGAARSVASAARSRSNAVRSRAASSQLGGRAPVRRPAPAGSPSAANQGGNTTNRPPGAAPQSPPRPTGAAAPSPAPRHGGTP